ncbi:MAG: hypothetical protein ACETWM_08125 [Candidatus Lokiarchaeia archaeon]
MFENFFSNITSILSTFIGIIVVIIIAYVFCLLLLYFKHDFLLYYMLRDQVRFIHWLIKSSANFLINHWRFVLTVSSFSAIYLVFYSALPGWTEVHTAQKHLVSLFSSTMITATAVVLAKRKMKWLLRLAPITTVSIATITAYYLYTESVYLVPQLTIQPFPLELVALVLIPSIIGIALSKKLYWRLKTRHQSNEVYLNPQGTISDNDNSNPNPSYDTVYRSSHFSKGNRGLSKIEKAYRVGSKREQHTSNPVCGARNLEKGDLSLLLESERKRMEKNLGRLFPEDQRNEGEERKRKGEDS